MPLLSSEHDAPLITSWVWGERAGQGKQLYALSPLDGLPLGSTLQLDQSEIEALLTPLSTPFSISPEEARAFAERLHSELERLSVPIFETLQRETGFVRTDCAEVRDGILGFARDFFEQGFVQSSEPGTQFYDAEGGTRAIQQVTIPWGTVAVVLPASSALFLGITCLLNALATGNRVILRFPAANPLSAALLCEAVERAQPPATSVSVVMAPAKALVGAIHECQSPILIHYLGSSRHAPALVSQGFASGQSVVTDGEGNTWLWVAPDADVKATVELLTQGAIRYNGQTCTSVNGAIVHPTLYDSVRAALIKRWEALRMGSPTEDGIDVGPLGDEEQAQWCLKRIESSGGQIVCGGTCQGNLLSPTLIEQPDEDSELVTQGLFGPALWLAPGGEDDFVRLWGHNRFPLCAGVLATQVEGALWATRLNNVARLVINGDPSIEWTFEPWGGYPASGNNPVSSWADKYRRAVALDIGAPTGENVA